MRGFTQNGFLLGNEGGSEYVEHCMTANWFKIFLSTNCLAIFSTKCIIKQRIELILASVQCKCGGEGPELQISADRSAWVNFHSALCDTEEKPSSLRRHCKEIDLQRALGRRVQGCAEPHLSQLLTDNNKEGGLSSYDDHHIII